MTKYFVKATDGDVALEDLYIQCADADELAEYTAECIRQGYTYVEAWVGEVKKR